MPTVKEAFVAASELPTDQRAAYLAALDDALRKRVEQLLQAADDAAGFLEPIANVDRTRAHPPTEAENVCSAGTVPSVGGSVGPFHLLRKLGEGGMGEVWAAEQSEPVRRTVALKLIRGGCGSTRAAARFEAERQAIALMEHPNIARLHDAGEVGGLSYFAMELVDGPPITEYCDRYRLPPERRIELFSAVCRGVQHAHQKGIIHRDLKPGNILVATVDGLPVPKVIDFGVAKATERDLETTSLTEAGAIVGTLQYMSPEQAEAANRDIDTRSDVYSLGVVLYELLTGTPPLEKATLKQAALFEMLRVIREVEPPRPSDRLSTTAELPSIAANRGLEPKRLSGILRGDLDWIVMKALEKDRNRRYPSAEAMSRDLQRFLALEPVDARPPSRGYRLRKFVRRNRAGVLAAGLMLILLLLGITGTTIGMWKARAAEAQARGDRDEARAAHASAQQALELVTGRAISSILAKNEPLDANAKALLRSALEQYRQYARKSGDDPVAKRDNVDACNRIGEIQSQLGDMQAAEDSYREALVILDQLPDGFEGVLLRRANAANNLGRLLNRLGRQKESEVAFRGGLDLWTKHGPQAGEPKFTLVSASIASNRGLLLLDLDRIDEAGRSFAKALEILRAADQNDSRLAFEFASMVGEAKHNIAVAHRRAGNMSKARKAYEEAIEVRRSILNDRTAPDDLRNLGLSLMNLANLLSTQNEPTPAFAHYREAVAIFRRLIVDYPAVPTYRQHAALAHLNFAMLLRRQRQLAEAVPEYQEARTLMKQLADWFPEVTGYRMELAGCHNGLGLALKNQYKLREALAEYDAAIALQTTLVATGSMPSVRSFLAISHNNRGNLLADMKRHPEAEVSYREAIRIRRELLAESPHNRGEELAVLETTIALAELMLHDPLRRKEAVELFESSLPRADALAKAEEPLSNTASARARIKLADVARNRGEPKVALAVLQAASPYVDRLPPSFRDVRYEHRLLLALASAQTGNVEAADKTAQTLFDSVFDPKAALFDAARVHALCASKTTSQEAMRHRGKTLEFLKQAVEKGFLDPARVEAAREFDDSPDREAIRPLLEKLRGP